MSVSSLIADHSLLCALSARARERLASLAHPRSLTAGEASATNEGEDLLIFITRGTVRASALVQGRIVFTDAGPGDVLGLLDALAGREQMPVALLALDDVEAFTLPAAAAVAAIGASAGAAMSLARRFAGLLDDRTAVADPLQRVYRDLLRAAKPLGETGWTIDPMPRHREVALRAGVAEEEAAAAIANLVRNGIVRRRYPALDIEDREALRALSI